MQKKLLKVYFIFLHILFVIVLLKSDFIHRVKTKFYPITTELTEYYHTMVSFHSTIDQSLPANTVLFIGDSHIQGLAVTAVDPNAVNYGIGGDTTYGVLRRLPVYKSVISAKAVVLAIGYNDLHYRDNAHIIENIEELIRYFPKELKIVLCSLHPIGAGAYNNSGEYNKRIVEINSSIRLLSNKYSNVTYSSVYDELSSDNSMLPMYHMPDGIHLNKKAYMIWIKGLAHSLENK